MCNIIFYQMKRVMGGNQSFKVAVVVNGHVFRNKDINIENTRIMKNKNDELLIRAMHYEALDILKEDLEIGYNTKFEMIEF